MLTGSGTLNNFGKTKENYIWQPKGQFSPQKRQNSRHKFIYDEEAQISLGKIVLYEKSIHSVFSLLDSQKKFKSENF